MIKLKKGEILVLRTCRMDMLAYGGFKWPKKGRVSSPDWLDNDKCGHGLHGLPWGVGSSVLFFGDKDKDTVWLLVKVNTAKGNYQHGTGEMTDKCKFKEGEVVYSGDRTAVVALLMKHAPAGLAVNYAVQAGGGDSTQTAGNHSTQKAGWDSTQTAGDESTQKAGEFSTQTAGGKSTQAAGWKSTQTAGDVSTQTAGEFSTQTAGNQSTQKAGLGTAQIIRWYEDVWRVKARIITEAEADKWYKFEGGDWRLCTAAEVFELDKKREKPA